MKIAPISNRITPSSKVKTVTNFKSAQLQPNLTAKKTSGFKKIISYIKQRFSAPPKITHEPCPDSAKNIQSVIQEASQKVLEQAPFVNDSKIEEMREFLCCPRLLADFFKSNPNININSKYANGDTLLLRILRDKDDGKLADDFRWFLYNDQFDYVKNNNKQYYDLDWNPEVDWNATDSEGNNAMCLLLNRFTKKSFNYNYVLHELSKLVDPAYINPQTKRTVLQEAIMQGNSNFINNYLASFPDIHDVANITHPDTPPALVMAFEKNIKAKALVKILNRTDLTTEYEGKTLFDYVKLKQADYGNIFDKKLHEAILLKRIINYSREFNPDRCNYMLDGCGGNIGHLIAMVHPHDEATANLIRDIVLSFGRIGYDFTSKNASGKTAVEIAIEGNNTYVTKCLLNVIPRDGHYPSREIYLPDLHLKPVIHSRYVHFDPDEYYENVRQLLIKYPTSDEEVIELYRKRSFKGVNDPPCKPKIAWWDIEWE